jgi:isopentenyl diphosphate isomerase/L-lactate dehydrogenase-like FMN-dependent dehydrogenase
VESHRQPCRKWHTRMANLQLPRVRKIKFIFSRFYNNYPTAAARENVVLILSTIATTSIEDVAAATPNATRWFQLYIYKDRKLTESIVRRAEKAGFQALVLTVDAPLFGLRRSDLRNKFSLPPHLSLANFQDVVTSMGGE